MKKALLLILLCSTVSGFSQETNFNFTSEQLELYGTLSLPESETPAPLIVLVHGSGPSDRDQSITLSDGNSACLYPNLFNQTIKNFKDLSDGLTEKGYAVYRYDKRTHTHANSLNPISISPYDFITDVHSAINALKLNTSIDTNNIVVLGHSQGANFLPILAQEREDIKALLALGTPETSIDTIMAMQFRELYYRCLNDTTTGDNFYNQTLADFEQIRNNTWPSNTAYLGAYTTFWNDWIEITESSLYNYNQISTPALFLHAMEDFNIPIEDAVTYDNELINPEHQLYFIDDLTHFFTTESASSVSQTAIDTISDWLSNTLEISEFNINQIGSKQFKIQSYTNRVNIFSNSNEPFDIIIYDLKGQLIHKKININHREYSINTDLLSSGYYILKVSNASECINSKISIQK